LCPQEQRVQGDTIIWRDAFIARLAARGTHEGRKGDSVAVAHLTVRWRCRGINQFVAGANDGDSRTTEYAHCRSASESQECQLPRVQNLTLCNEFIAAVEVFTRREHAIAQDYRRENSNHGSISLYAFMRNHGIGAAWKWCSSRDGQGSSEREVRIALFSKHLPRHGDVDRIVLRRQGTLICPHCVSIHCRARKRHRVFIGDHRVSRDSSECLSERNVLPRQWLHGR
jgi:hypothetical protein